MSEHRPKMEHKTADMVAELQEEIEILAQVALEKFSIDRDIAAYLKQELDSRHSPAWHVIVGKNFGSFVTHETKHLIYFYMKQTAFLVFKSG